VRVRVCVCMCVRVWLFLMSLSGTLILPAASIDSSQLFLSAHVRSLLKRISSVFAAGVRGMWVRAYVCVCTCVCVCVLRSCNAEFACVSRARMMGRRYA